MRRISRWHGRSPRAPWHDQRDGGWYFITIISSGRIPLFARIVGRRLVLTAPGEIVAGEWSKTAKIRPEVTLGPWVVMPDHFHALIGISLPARNREEVEPPRLIRHPRSIGAVVSGFKGTCTKQINQLRRSPGEPVWQSHYYDRMIRNEKHWKACARYIEENPSRLLAKLRVPQA